GSGPLPSAERMLSEMEAVFAQVFHSNPDAIVLTDLDEGHVFDANDAFCRMLRRERDEVLGRTTVELGLWGEDERQNGIRQLREDGVVEGMERTVSVRGQVRRFETWLRVFHASGEERLIGVTRDVTRAHAAERRLAEVARFAAAAARSGERAVESGLEAVAAELGANGGAIYRDAGAGALEQEACVVASGDPPPATLPSGEGTPWTMALAAERPLVVSDLRSDARFSLAARIRGWRSLAVAPVGGSAVLCAYSARPRPLGDGEREFVGAIAAVLAAAGTGRKPPGAQRLLPL
ncbi:MAG: PAS domain S-box protein, partial [Solirubrobacteraceae bacterium]